MREFPGKNKKILIIVENLPVPFDTRVWQEANALVENGYEVSIISPKGKDYETNYECLNSAHIYRHSMPAEGQGAAGYLIEYTAALFWEFILSLKVLFKHGFDAIHACNPPDNIFLIGLFYRIFGKKFVFDHHDINPELYIAKFGRKDFFYYLLLLFERLTFMSSDISIATNESYKKIAVERGKMNPDRVFVVRSGPRLERLKILPPKEEIKRGKKYMIGYVGVIGQQEGIPYLLQAAQHIRQQGRDDIFYGIVGGGTYLEEAKEQCRAMGLDDIVEFTGRVPDEVMLDYLNTADICVNPDEHNEMNDKSTMNKIMEYMCLAKPIVQFDLTEGRFSAQESSLYAKSNDYRDLADKILYILEMNNEERRKMGQYGRERVEKELKWDISKQNLIRAYDYLFSKK